MWVNLDHIEAHIHTYVENNFMRIIVKIASNIAYKFKIMILSHFPASESDWFHIKKYATVANGSTAIDDLHATLAIDYACITRTTQNNNNDKHLFSS